MKFFCCVALLLAVSTATVSSTEQTAAGHRELQQLGISTMARDLVKAVNDVRASKGAKSLCLHSKLTIASQVQAVDMANGGFISATGSSGSTPTSRAEAQKFNTTGVAEAVGAGYSNASHAIGEWMKSTDYSQYLLGDYEFLGAGYAMNSTQVYKTFWVLDFSQGGRGETCA